MYLYQILVDAVETLKMPEFRHSPQTQTCKGCAEGRVPCWFFTVFRLFVCVL